MGTKKEKKDRRRSQSRSRSPTPSSSSSRSPSRSRSRSRSRDRSSRKRNRHSSSKSSKRDKDRKPKKERTRSRSRSRERKKRRRSPSSSTDESRSRSRSRSVKREAKREQPAPAASSSALSSAELRRIKEEEKARLKATETPAERNARRAAKKALKHGGGDLGASVSAPSGGDKVFVWKKKYERNIAEGLDPKILTRAELAQKQVLLAEEIAAIKARKIARAEEKEQMDALRESMAREAEAENIEGWEEKEEEFHRNNAKLRTAIRIREGREKLVDVLAKNRALYRALKKGPSPDDLKDHPEWLGATLDPNLSPETDIELTEAHKLLSSGDVPWRDLEYLEQDIAAISLLEPEDTAYWAACSALTRASIVKQKAAVFGGAAAAAASGGAGGPSSDALKEDMASLLRGKDTSELRLLERDIDALLAGQRPAALMHLQSMDHTYWDALKGELAHFKHAALLREFHLELLELRLKDLQTYIVREKERSAARREQERAERAARGEAPEEPEEALPEEDEMDFEPTLIPHAEYDAEHGAGEAEEDEGSFSPVLVPADEDDALDKHAAAARAIAAIDPDADARELAEQRRQVAMQKQHENEERARLAAGSAVSAPVVAGAGAGTISVDGDESAFRRESARGLESDEVQLRNELSIPSQTYWWQDKYRPRKPRFFNRVKTGFEWNKYNSSHYDKENPPPKIVQGYKFHIFYPDLIDATAAPRYRIEPDPAGNPDFCVIRFMAGPPYEDLAFKIVRKEWEYSFKRGYKCVFDRGVLALYFNFRRYFYRR